MSFFIYTIIILVVGPDFIIIIFFLGGRGVIYKLNSKENEL